MRVVILVIAFLSLTACATNRAYKGNRLSKENISTLDAFSYEKSGLPPKYELYMIMKVNDVVLCDIVKCNAKAVEMLPGKNTISFEYRNNLEASIIHKIFSTGFIGLHVPNSDTDHVSISITFDSEAGHDYKIMFYPNILSGGKLVPQPWVVDKTTKEIVYGKMPPEAQNLEIYSK